MGYLFLSVVLLAGATSGYFSKRTSSYTETLGDTVIATAMRMALCIVFSFILVPMTGQMSDLIPNPTLLLTAAMYGFFMAFYAVLWFLCVRKSAYMMLDIFLMLGILIPLIASNAFFCETITLTQWIGVAVLFGAVLIMCSYNNTIKAKLTPTTLLLLIGCGASSGLSEFSQKLFVQYNTDSSAAAFNFYCAIFCTLTLCAYLIFTRQFKMSSVKRMSNNVCGYIVILAICQFVGAYFKTLAAERLDAILLFPLSHGGALILASVVASVFLKEKLTVKATIGIVAAFIGVMIINFL